MSCIRAVIPALYRLKALLFTLISLAILTPANAQTINLLEVDAPTDIQNLAPGETQSWRVDLPKGGYDLIINVVGGAPDILIEQSGGFPETIQQASGYIYRGANVTEAEVWTITLTAQETISASYTLFIESWPVIPGADSPFPEEFADDMNDDIFGDVSGFGTDLGASGSMLSNIIDNLLSLFGRTVLPFLILYIVQSITIFFVLRSMMSASNKQAEAENLAEQTATIRGARTDTIAFDERRHKDEIARFADDRSRLHRLNKQNAYSRWWLLTILIVFLIGSTLAVQHMSVAGAQALLALILWVYFAVRARPIGIGFSLIVVLAFAAPLLFAQTSGTILEPSLRNGLIALSALLTALGLLIWRNRYRASKFPKQDLLVLRVFGMDQSAKETFGTIARSWSWLGASATIADPSYIKYLFSGWRGNVWKFILVVGATLLAGLAQFSPFISGLIPDSFSDVQRFSALMLGAFIVLIPVITIPIFLQVRFSFIKDRAKLINKITQLMGQKKRPNGFHRHRPFFCHDDLWRPAVQKMMEEAEVVLMDFRGFDPSNLGCAYEVGKIVNTVDLDHVVLFVDDGEGKDVLYRIFESCWDQRAPGSPNAGKTEPVLNVYIGQEFISWRHGIGRWLWSIVTGRRWRQWSEDSKGIVARLSTVAPDQAAA